MASTAACCADSSCSFAATDLVIKELVAAAAARSCSTCCAVSTAAYPLTTAISSWPKTALLLSHGCCAAALSATTTLLRSSVTMLGQPSTRARITTACESLQQQAVPASAPDGVNVCCCCCCPPRLGSCWEPVAASTSSCSSLQARHQQTRQTNEHLVKWNLQLRATAMMAQSVPKHHHHNNKWLYMRPYMPLSATCLPCMAVQQLEQCGQERARRRKSGSSRT
ncbi:hypothetical protein COO60DRAFT_916259 [Scenedesmus sp. NREL 46B-D3]|nr:hypothetical protein COO60DRAFT_916259 [Scenedesmus sp. NREL 46B-D3]